ncbi:N-alpha-acetyltransferase 80-like [Diadema antillarum]|uniref:N-alpha-acetyltransferase 80-like n=1 Tax=Diadema antillarum TaxID=105358 RepID=UPI003A890FB5
MGAVNFNIFTIKALHENKELTDDCVQLLNDEWPRSKAARLFSVSKSCSTLPYSLVLVEHEDTVVGYCRLAKVISDTSSVLVESVVVDKNRRGQGLGRLLMELCERHAFASGYKKMYLCTKDKQDFYQHLGYSFCKAVNTLGAQMLETCDCLPSETNTSLQEQVSCASSCSDGSSRFGTKTTVASNFSSCGPQAAEKPSSCCENQTQETAKSQYGEFTSSPSGPPPPPPPPPKLLASAKNPATVIYWMMKDIA